MLRLVLAAVALTGCDRLLQLQDVHVGSDGGSGSGDAPMLDGAGGPDAPPLLGCTPGIAPLFTATPTSVASNCSHYTSGKDSWQGGELDIAICQGMIVSVNIGGVTSETGPVGAAPAQSGDGELYVNSNAIIYKYTQTATPHQWSSPVAQNIGGVGASDEATAASGMKSSSMRRMVLFHPTSPNWTASELIESGADTWSSLGAFSSSETGTITSPGSLSHDGLRLVYVGATGVMFMARSTPSAAFSQPVQIYTATATNPYLSEDCTKLYFTTTSGGLAVVTSAGP